MGEETQLRVRPAGGDIRHSRRLSEATKREVLRRFAGRCALCLAEVQAGRSAHGPPRTLRPEMAHFRAWSQGGSNSTDNIIPLCLDHHEKFDKQQQSGRMAVVLGALLDESRVVSESTVSRVRREILVLPEDTTFDDRRREIWGIKAKERLGPSLLVEEAEILSKTGESSEAWEALRMLFRFFVAPSDHLEVSRGLAVAGDVALAYGDHKLGIALFRESEANLRDVRLSSGEVLNARIRVTRGIANCLLMSTPTGSRLLAFADLDLTARDAKDAARSNPDVVCGATNLEALCIVRDALGVRLNRGDRRPDTYIKRLTRLGDTLQGIDPLGAAYRAVNIGQVLLLLGHYSDSHDVLEIGKQRLLALGEVWNASVAGHQQVESLVKGMRVSRSTANFERALVTLRASVQLAGQVSNHDRYWDNMLANLRWMEHNLAPSHAGGSFFRGEQGAEPPFGLGALLPRHWPYRTRQMKAQAASRGGKIRLVPQSNVQEMVDLRRDLEAILHGPRGHGGSFRAEQ
jgi:hypothetical protein